MMIGSQPEAVALSKQYRHHFVGGHRKNCIEKNLCFFDGVAAKCYDKYFTPR
jgi:hypothetical protein